MKRCLLCVGRCQSSVHAAEYAMLELMSMVNCDGGALLLMLRGRAAAAMLNQHGRALWRFSEWSDS